MPFIPTLGDRVCVPSGGNLARAVRGTLSKTQLLLERGGEYVVERLRVPWDYFTIASYGDRMAPPPKILLTEPDSLWARGTHNVIFDGLDFTSMCGNAMGLRLLGCRDILFRGCSFHGCAAGVSAEDDPEFGVCRRITVQGSTFASRVPRATAVQARRAGSVTLLDSCFDGTSVHLCGDCETGQIARCLFVGVPGTALKAAGGGLVTDSLFVDNTAHLDFGLVDDDGPVALSGVEGQVRGNIFLGGQRGIRLADVRHATVAANLMEGGGASPAIELTGCTGTWAEDSTGVMAVALKHNWVWNWGGGAFRVDPRLQEGDLTGNWSFGNLEVQDRWEPPHPVALRATLNGQVEKLRKQWNLPLPKVLEELRHTVG